MISKIHIENFRSIDKLTLSPTNLTAIVGPNSVGKTNILRALEILLGETYPTERAFSKDDFHKKDTSKDIVIQVWFDEPLEVCKLKSCEDYKESWCETVSIKLVHSRTDGSRTKLLAVNNQGMEYYANGRLRDQHCLIYIPSDRNLDRQMTASQWTLLGKILKRIDENFRKRKEGEEYSELEVKFREAMISPKEILESEFEGDLNYKLFKTTFITICQEYAKGLTHGFDVDLEVYDPLFYYKTIQILANEKKLGNFNVQELGSGVQNLVLLSLFRTYAKIMKDKTILAIEEPEIYLYPQAQRQLYKNFRLLAYPEQEIGSQIFYTTHSPNFIDASNYEEIIMLKKDHSTLQRERTDKLAHGDKEELKLITEFNSERNEMFFADKVLLVEGETEKHAIPYLFTTLGYPTEINNISIIAANGKDKLRFLIKVCKACGIDWVALFDTDTEIKEKIKKLKSISGLDPVKLKKLQETDDANDKLNSELQSFDAIRVIPLDYNIQKVLNLPSHKTSKWQEIKEARDLCLTLPEDKIPNEFKKVIQVFYPPQLEPKEIETVKIVVTRAEAIIPEDDIPF